MCSLTSQQRELVLAKRDSKSVHTVMLDQRKWLSVLECMNTTDDMIPKFYIFKGKRFRKDFIEKCEMADNFLDEKHFVFEIVFSFHYNYK